MHFPCEERRCVFRAEAKIREGKAPIFARATDDLGWFAIVVRTLSRRRGRRN